uniref:Uncharacterized protein n=1 Tax=Romanomermis culicivorax TaxID=13658 RepID=A0A915JCL7_ROMCU
MEEVEGKKEEDMSKNGAGNYNPIPIAPRKSSKLILPDPTPVNALTKAAQKYFTGLNDARR